MSELILASTSPYRRELLGRLGWPFQSRGPHFDEEAAKLRAPREPAARAAYLARGKAQSLAAPGVIVIGGDQLVCCDDRIFDKPGSPEKAVEQLSLLNGREHRILTAVCVCGPDGTLHEWVHEARLTMRKLSREQLTEYVRLDQPVDCAGSYKIEKHGLLLFENIDCDDFSAIQGLPLLSLARTLVKLGLVPFAKGST